jgi:hypothetical protein
MNTHIEKIGLLIQQWSPGVHGAEGSEASWEVAAVFSHDYEHHLLVWQWFRDDSGVFQRAGFSLWFAPASGPIVLCKLYKRALRPPFVDAAAQVGLWGSLRSEHLERD